jgi:glycosyltransferase involved in cell wall biosynthesis
MPLVEALAAGLPTACSAIEPLKSLAAGAAVLFDPDDQAGMVEAIERILCDEPERERLSAAGKIRAADFSWSRAAMETLQILRRAAGS